MNDFADERCVGEFRNNSSPLLILILILDKSEIRQLVMVISEELINPREHFNLNLHHAIKGFLRRSRRFCGAVERASEQAFRVEYSFGFILYDF